MSLDGRCTRRGLLARAMAVTGTAALGLAAARASAQTCGLPVIEAERKRALGYVEHSPDPARRCDACMFYDDRGSCGNCRILSTLVDPAGSCNSWGARPKGG